LVLKEEILAMRSSKYFPISASFVLALATVSPAVAQSDNMPWVEMESTSVMLGLGSQSGEGLLRLPNLGTNCVYPFKIDGFGGGIQVGVSRVSTAGLVNNLTRLEEFPGQYSATQGESTLIAGGGGMSMRNRAYNVTMDLKSRTEGLALGVGGQGMTIKMNLPMTNAPRVYILEFGFNKSWLGDDTRAKLAQVISAWKCRYVAIELVGATDTVGKEDKNLELSQKRAASVRDYLLGAGVVASRISAHAAGENEPLVPTGQGVRLRANRIVVLTIRNI
jgi:outer membrane protein OmpA-like peptidoglycan-associated protein